MPDQMRVLIAGDDAALRHGLRVPLPTPFDWDVLRARVQTGAGTT